DSAHRLKLWDAATGEERRGPEGHDGTVQALAFSPDGRTLAAAGGAVHEKKVTGGAVTLWDTNTLQPQLHLAELQTVVFGMAFSPDGATLALGCGDGTVRLV